MKSNFGGFRDIIKSYTGSRQVQSHFITGGTILKLKSRKENMSLYKNILGLKESICNFAPSASSRTRPYIKQLRFSPTW